jgi:glycine C-acetyltransferase
VQGPRWRYTHNDMADLERCLEEARAGGARFILVFTDGVFSMDGTIAQLDRIRALCDRFGALLGVDESHATGFMGTTGRGTHEHRGIFGKVDIITGTLGKALGGASGGFTAARKEVVELLRQRSRPYLFSNTVAPSIVGASLKVLDLLEGSTALRDKLADNTAYFRRAIVEAGFEIKPGEHPIVPIMVYDAVKAQQLAARLLELGVYVVGFFYPVVPQGQARIRVQLSAAHDRAQLERAVAAFAQAGRELGLLKGDAR